MKAITTATEFIKAQTAIAHERSDRLLAPYVMWIYTIADYARLLNCLHDFYAPVEELLNAYMPALLPDYEHRRKAAWLVQDLTVLSIPAVQEARPTMPVIQQPADAWGCFYVLEGLVIGGDMVKMIQSNCPDIPENSMTFFAGYQHQNIFMWRTFLSCFNEALQTEAQQMAAATAANDCFTQFRMNIQLHYSNHRS